ncbi:hypothetical protein V8F06_012583 [Rhypophila decipiens]
MSASFNSLPVELVMEIVKHVDNKLYIRRDSHNPHNRPIARSHIPNQSTLAALNRTSKLLNLLTTRCLYRAPRYHHRNWPLLARTLLLRKDLAALVKDLWFHGSPSDDASDPDKFPDEVAKLYLEHYQPRRAYGSPTIDAEENESLKGKSSVAMDIILSCCSQSVEAIFVDLELGCEAFRMIQAPSALPALKIISFDYINPVTQPGYIGRAPQLENLIKTAAPTLTTLQLCRLRVHHPIKCVLEKVTHLAICNSYMTPKGLNSLLRHVPNLEILEYEAEPEPDEDYEGSVDFWRHYQGQFFVDDAFDAIEKNCKKLKAFLLDMSADYEVDWASTSLRESLGNIARQFESKGIKFRMTF